jgi:hypothetical protein
VVSGEVKLLGRAESSGASGGFLRVIPFFRAVRVSGRMRVAAAGLEPRRDGHKKHKKAQKKTGGFGGSFLFGSDPLRAKLRREPVRRTAVVG